ncbi:hypothetical protein HK104_002046, partial [Borealophlyctis nickersoniae]
MSRNNSNVLRGGLGSTGPQATASYQAQNGNSAKEGAAWDLDFLAATPIVSAIPSEPTSVADPFDLAFLGTQAKAASPQLESMAEDDNPLGILAAPYKPQPPSTSQPSPVQKSSPLPSPSARAPSSPTPPPPPPEPKTAHDLEIAQIVDMGFDAKSAQTALEATQYNVTAAIEMLVQNREAERRLGRETPRSRQASSQPVAENRPHRVAKFKDDYEDDSDMETYGRLRDDGSVPDGGRYGGRERRTGGADWVGEDEEGSERGSTINQEKLVATASAIGKSVFNNAKSVFAYSKKKISEAVEKAQAQVGEGQEGREDGDEARGAWRTRGGSATKRREALDQSERGNGMGYRDEDSSEDEAGGMMGGRSNAYAKYTDMGGKPGTFSDSSDEEELPRRTVRPGSATRQQAPSPASPERKPYFHPEILSRQPEIIPRSSPTARSPSPPPPPPRQPTPPPAVTATPQQLSDSNAHKEKGNLLFKQGQFADAEVCYTASISALPVGHLNLVALYNNRAAARLKTGHYREAIDDCNAVQALDPKDVKSLLRRATAWEALEKWEEARRDYKAIMELDGSVKGVSQGLARCAKALQPDGAVSKSMKEPAKAATSNGAG